MHNKKLRIVERLIDALVLPAAAALLLGVAAAPAHADGPLLTPFSGAPLGAAPAPWRFTTLPNKIPTRFEITELDGKHVLKVEADKSYGNLVHATRVQLNGQATLDWRWRVEEFVAGADLHTRDGDDGAAKLCVFFDFPTDKLPLGERTRLALAHSATGELVPAQTLCYVWDNKEPKDSEFANAFTDRMEMDVIESGPTTPAGGWLGEKRNLKADYQRAFGKEAGNFLPDVIAIAVSADADNTKAQGIAYYSDIELHGTPPAAGAAAPTGQ
ncbi:MAG TPA: DUF3047 domain-containing protein [Variovorax sp.]|jgi:hypothetical protein